MKRRDLIRRINEIAKSKGMEAFYKEGGNHTKVVLGNVQTVIPRHNEIKEPLAQKIIKFLEDD